jgi:hypothetical protein
MTASGKVLSSNLFELPTKGMAEFRALPEADRRPRTLAAIPEDGVGRPLSPPPGVLSLRLYQTGFTRDQSGQLVRLPDLARQIASKGYAGIVVGGLATGPQRDYLWLTEAEWKRMLPAQPVAGQKTLVAPAIVNRIARFYLYDYMYKLGRNNICWGPSDCRAAELSLTVEEASAAGTRCRLEGFARLADQAEPARASRKGEFRLLGWLNYNVQTQRIDRFDLVALGEYTSPQEPEVWGGIVAYKYPVTLGVAFELAVPGSLGYGYPPAPIREHHPGDLFDYFGVDSLTKIDPGILRYCGLKAP